MRYNGIIKEDLVNSKGTINCTIFFQGCNHQCKGCFNMDCWDFNGGYEFTLEKQDKFIELCKKDYIQAISILGGEPLQQPLDELLIFLKRLKEEVNKPIWLWTGYVIEEIRENEEMNKCLDYIDFIIDGKYDETQNKNVKSNLYGSNNQRIIELTK